MRLINFGSLALTLIAVSSVNGIAQNKYDLTLKFDAYSLPLNSRVTHENGLGYYQVNAEAKANEALLIDFTWWAHKSMGLSIGGAIHSYRYHASHIITDPTDETKTLYNNYRVFSALAWGPCVSLNFRKNALQARLSHFIAVEPFRKKRSHESNSFITFIFNPIDQTSASLEIQETIGVSASQSAYSLFQIALQYEVRNGLFFSLGLESTVRQNFDSHYKLRVVGNTEQTTPEEHILNDFRLSTKYQAITIGLGYSFGFGSYKDD